MKIPKIIHQTWKSKAIPIGFADFTHSWKVHHPDWEYRLWDDGDNRQFIQESYPWFLRLYDNYSLHIQRIDAVRYFILYHYGGMYVDMDFECFKSVEPLLRDATCVFCLESRAHCRIHHLDRIVSNAFMACVPKHPFLHAIIKELISYVPQQTDYRQFVLETTGPLMVSRVYDKFENKGRVAMLPSEALFPLSYLESESYLQGQRPPSVQEKMKDAYGVHYHAGSWWKDPSPVK